MPAEVKTKSSRIIEIEALTIATDLLPEVNTEDLISKHGEEVQMVSDLPPQMVDLGSHAFLGGMYQAYAEHRPFTISPEMIWLLIQQGISMHLYRSVGSVLKFYPELIEKRELEVRRSQSNFEKSDWEEIISSFIDHMDTYLDNVFLDQFRINFSESSQDERTVGDLMIMDAMRPYFEYIVVSFVCGIPSVELRGTSGDWDKILEKLSYFRKFDLDWWFDKIEPVLEQIRSSVNGNSSTEFWMNMFKVHTKKEYGQPKIIDGWIMKFYPFDEKGQRILDKGLQGLSVEDIFKKLPSELKSIPFTLKFENAWEQTMTEKKLAFKAGFVGLSQEPSTMRLCPEMGWFVGMDTEVTRLEPPYQMLGGDSREYFSLEDFPSELLSGEEFGQLILHFKREIKYPEEITALKVNTLMLNGVLPEGMLEDLKSKFKSSTVKVMLNYDYTGIFNE